MTSIEQFKDDIQHDDSDVCPSCGESIEVYAALTNCKKCFAPVGKIKLRLGDRVVEGVTGTLTIVEPNTGDDLVNQGTSLDPGIS